MKRSRFGSETAQAFSRFGSNSSVSFVSAVNGQLAVQALHIPPGGSIGAHRGRMTYLLLITAGTGWIRTNGGAPEPVAVGDAITWSVHETREVGSDEGLEGVWIQYALGGVLGPQRRFTARGVRWAVYMETGNELEQRACDQLERLLQTYDVSRWTFTTVIRICDFAVPHSHPALTLNTLHLDDDLAALSTFVHEQIHWYEEAHSDQVALAMDDFRQLYPNAPAEGPTGGHDLESTYLHLIVCPLEFAALRMLLGEEKAREVLQGKRYYTWIYERTLTDRDQIAAVLDRHGLMSF